MKPPAAEIPNPEIPNPKKIPKTQITKSQKIPMSEKPDDLEERTAVFAETTRAFVRNLPRTITNIEDVRQLVRASGSVAANCIEANESLGPKDKLFRFRLCRKEAKETALWLRLLHTNNDPQLDLRRKALQQESRELRLILSAIIRKLE
jgi:four helix bundle protein